MDKFRTAKGELSRYAFACGYIQRYECAEAKRTVVMSMEHGSYDVKTYDYARRDSINQNGLDDWNVEGGWRTWETFEARGLTKARAYYNDKVKRWAK